MPWIDPLPRIPLTAPSAPPLSALPGHPLRTGARTTSLVVLGLWALTRAVEMGVTLYVRQAVLHPPPR